MTMKNLPKFCIFLAVVSFIFTNGKLYDDCKVPEAVSFNTNDVKAHQNYSWCYSQNTFVGPHVIRPIEIADQEEIDKILPKPYFRTLCRFTLTSDPLSYLCKDFNTMKAVGVPIIQEDFLFHQNFTLPKNVLDQVRRTILALSDVNNYIHLFDVNLNKIASHPNFTLTPAHPLPKEPNSIINLEYENIGLISENWRPSFVSKMIDIEMFGVAYLFSTNGLQIKFWRVQSVPPSAEGGMNTDILSSYIPTSLSTSSLSSFTWKDSSIFTQRSPAVSSFERSEFQFKGEKKEEKRRREKRQHVPDRKHPDWTPLKVSWNDSLQLEECIFTNFEHIFDQVEVMSVTIKKSDTIIDPIRYVVVVALLKNYFPNATITFIEFVVKDPNIFNSKKGICDEFEKGSTFTWKIQRNPLGLSMDNRIKMAIGKHYGDLNATATADNCATWNLDRYLVHLYSYNRVWSFPFNDRNERIVNSFVEPGLSGGLHREIVLNEQNSVANFNPYEHHVTSVSQISDCRHNPDKKSQGLWLSISAQRLSRNYTLNSTIEFSDLFVIPMPEFAEHDFGCKGKTILVAKSGDCFYDVMMRCNWASRMDRPVIGCVDRLAFSRTMSIPSDVRELQTRSVSQPVLISAANSTMSRIEVEHHHLIFAQALNEHFIIAFQNGPELDSVFDPQSGVFKLINRRFTGPVNQIEVSENSQHVWTLNEIPFPQIDGRIRTRDWCNDHRPIHGQPSQLYLDTCNELTMPQIFQPQDYLSYYSMCALSKQVCPLLKGNVVVDIPTGYFSLNPADLYPCQKGFYCVEGRIIPCLLGFICPEPKLSEPVRCSYDPTFTTSCYNLGLSEPMPCPEGHICIRPESVPIATPPSWYIDISDKSAKDLAQALKPCKQGYYCPIAKSLAENSPPDCPPGFICPTPSTIVECKSSHPDVKGPGSMDFYCPAGSVEPRICPKGHLCPDPRVAVPCQEHLYCPEGTPDVQYCPCGFYCPNVTSKIVCPKGYWCPEKSIAPRECHWHSVCLEGSCKENIIIFMVLILLSCLPFLWLIFRQYLPVWLYTQRHLPSDENYIGKSFLKTALLAGTDFGFAVSGTISSSFPVKQTPLNIEILDIEYSTGNKRIISGISGFFESGKVTAIMGPSGCGKSTLLSILSGQVAPTHGQILINGHPENMSDLRTVMGFVPQNDIMLRTLTVRETLFFYAQMKAATVLTSNQLETMVSRIIQLLGLTKAQNSIIGDEKVRGISGGELKRVNIGIELVGEPTLLFLDEPTSGLDSTITGELISVLKRVAAIGLTIITVIHQPRYEVFNMFDNVLLIGSHGKTTYFGPARYCEPFFKKLGYKRPKVTNPADFFLDIANGRITPEANPLSISASDNWNESGKQLLQEIEKESTLKEERSKEKARTPHSFEYRKHRRTPSSDLKATKGGKSFRELTLSSTSRFASKSNSEADLLGAGNEYLELPISGEALKASLSALTNKLKKNISTHISFGSSPYPQESPMISDDTDSPMASPVVLRKQSADSTPKRISYQDDDTSIQNEEKQILLTEEKAEGKEEVLPKAARIRSSTNKIAPLWLQFFMFFKRGLTQIGRDPHAVMIAILLSWIGAMAVGLSAGRQKIFPEEMVQPTFNLLSLAAGLIGVQSSIRVFGGETTVFWRETRAGISPPMYFFGKAISHLPILFMLPLALLSTFSLIVPFQGDLWPAYCIVFSAVFCASGIGYMVSVIFTPFNATVVGCLYPLLCNVFAGVSPGLSELRQTTFGRTMGDFSYARWVVAGLLENEGLSLTNKTLPQQTIDDFRKWQNGDGYYPVHARWDSFHMMISYGLIFRLLALLILIYTNQGNKWAKPKPVKKRQVASSV